MSSFTYLDKFTNNYPRTQLSLANTYGIRTPTTVHRWYMADGVSHCPGLEIIQKTGPYEYNQNKFGKNVSKMPLFKLRVLISLLLSNLCPRLMIGFPYSNTEEKISVLKLRVNTLVYHIQTKIEKCTESIQILQVFFPVETKVFL